MMLGLGSYAFPWATGLCQPPCRPPRRGRTAPQRRGSMDVFGLLRRARSLGLRVVQVCDNLPLDLLSESALRRLRTTADHWGIAIEIGTRGIHRERLSRYLELACFFRSPFLRLVVDALEDTPTPEETVARLRPIVPAFAQAGVKLAIENHGRFSAVALKNLVRELKTRQVGICLDTVNSLGIGEGLAQTVEELAPLTLSVHLKDFWVRRQDHQMGLMVEGCPAGTGCLPVPWLLRQLRRHRCKANLILEQWVPPEATLPATLEKERRWARRSIQNLRPWFPADQDQTRSKICIC